MKLLTKAIENKLAKTPLHSTDGQDMSPVIVKFFTPWSNWTWYVLEGEKDDANGDWTFFGLVEGHETELGYFSLSDLMNVRGPFGLKIERDMHFKNCSVHKPTNAVLGHLKSKDCLCTYCTPPGTLLISLSE